MINTNRSRTIKNILEKQTRFFLHLKKPKPLKNTTRLMTQNLLAPSNIKKNHYKEQTYFELEKEGRYKLLKNEIRQNKPDILCLQELETSDLSNFANFSKNLGMDYIYEKKGCKSKTDGNAIFYNENKFEFLKKYFIDFNFKNGNGYEKDDILKKEMVYPSNAIFGVFRMKDKGKKKILVVNTHLLFNPKKGDLKLSMIILIKKSIKEIKKVHKIEDVFLIGDFNLVPNSMIYDYLTKNTIDLDVDLQEFSNQNMVMENKAKKLEEIINLTDRNFFPIKKSRKEKMNKMLVERLINISPVISNDNEEINFSINKLKEKVNFEKIILKLENLSKENQFISLYSKFNILYNQENGLNISKFQNYENLLSHFTQEIQSNVDYLFMSSNNFVVKSVLKNPDLEFLKGLEKTIPTQHFGSDHFSLVADLGLKN